MRIYILALFLSVGTVAAVAQVRQDPRPLHGLKPEVLPPKVSFSEIARHAVPGGVLRGAQYVSKATIEPREALQHGSLHIGSTEKQLHQLWKILRSENGTVNWMWRIGNAPKHREEPQAVRSPLDILTSVKDILRIANPKQEFLVENDKIDELGFRHIRFKQAYKGIPVWKRDLYVHLDETKELYLINGTYEITPKSVTTTPSIASAEALRIANDDLKANGHLAANDPATMHSLGIEQPIATLVLYPEYGSLRLAYDVDIHPNLHEHFSILVDASSGSIIRSIPLHCSLVPSQQRTATPIPGLTNAAGRSKASMPLAGFAASSGTDLNGANRNFRTYQHTDNQFYMLWDLQSYNAAGSTPPNDVKGGGLTLDLKNNDASNTADLFHVTSSNNTWSDPGAVSAHANMNVCYDYYRTTFSRNAIDGQNGTIISIVNVTENGASMENAYWNGKLMLYGNGGTTFKPLAGSLDVAGHEMTHGVTNNSADLIYEFQSGALNESFSDVFGVFIDDDDLTVGEQVIQPGRGTCLRNLENPADPNAVSKQPTHMNEFQQLGADQDNGGVHINSGIPNRAAAIIINAIGRTKAQQIYYRALTNYLTRNSQFIDCRIACETAAKDIHGDGSAEMQAVSNAFATVGIGGAPSNPNQDDVPSQTGGTDYVIFIWGGSNKIGFLEPDDTTRQAFEFTSPNAVARVDNTPNGIDRCQITAPRNGKNIYFIDPTGHLAFVEATTGTVFNFPNLFIQQNGDLWNASISPDEDYVAIASAYAQDPNMYIFDGQQLFTLKLQPQVPDGPSPQETIQYPDVMHWSPNWNEPRIAFDAYNEEDLAGDGFISYWSMYEINFSTGRIYSLIPSQPEDISIGNVTYSSLDPDIIGFNVIDQTASDIWIGDFERGDIFPLQIWNRTINGSAIVDADRPSFAPNDQYIAFTSAANNALCYIDAVGNVSFVSYSQPLYNPHWLLLGGSGSVAKSDHFFQSLTAYPSITDRHTTLRFTSRGSTEVRVEIVNALGATVLEAFSGKLVAGEQELSLDLGDLAEGAYLVRLTDGEHQAYTKLVIE